MTCVSRVLSRIESCAVPGFFQGRGGGQTQRPDNSLGVFFSPPTYFTVYRGGPMVLLQRQLYFSMDPERVKHFPGGGGGGGGVWTPTPFLWIRV